MSAGAIVAIIVAVVVVLAVIGAVSAARRRKLQRRFGPEYDRVVGEKRSHRKADAELAERERRFRDLDIHPLDETSRARYAGEWTALQEQFVDQPQQAVAQAGMLVTAVMKDRGYPTENYDQTLADLSVEHAKTLDHYRQGHDISLRAEAGTASTEDLRLAMLHYRALFADLLGRPGEAQDTRTAPAGPDGTQGTPAAPDETRGSTPAAPDETRGSTPAAPDGTRGTPTGGPDAAEGERSAVPGPRSGPAA
jgi:hypothetical protein